MIIKTRKLPPTQNDSARMRATDTDSGATLTIPYPHDSSDPNLTVALMLARAYGHESVGKVLAYNMYQTTGS